MNRVLRRLLLGWVGLGLASCLSPTLPLPPPAEPQLSAPDALGLVRVQGIAVSHAQVFAYNRDNGLIAGQVTADSARYDFRMEAEVDDTIEVWYQKGGEESGSVVVTVPAE